MTPEEMMTTIRTLQTRVDELERLVTLPLRVPRAVTAVTPSEVTRGRMVLNYGGTGAADTVGVVLKAADETYSEVTVATG